jgi:hypothetical protein
VDGLRHVSIKFRYALDADIAKVDAEAEGDNSDLDKLAMISSRPNYLTVVFTIDNIVYRLSL